jgi:hypothetical protein
VRRVRDVRRFKGRHLTGHSPHVAELALEAARLSGLDGLDDLRVATLPSGARLDENLIHLWTFGDDGKVVALRRMLDTAAHIAAARA